MPESCLTHLAVWDKEKPWGCVESESGAGCVYLNGDEEILSLSQD